ncbi:MAG: DUF2782 domain-containing protein [Gammaproteobacteria bacterium]|nr:DUF2782 domain-containing protein [Gammaproteobacteria bacterium]
MSRFHRAQASAVVLGALCALCAQWAVAADARPPSLRSDAPPPLPSKVRSGQPLENVRAQDQRPVVENGTAFRSSGEVVGVEVRPANSSSRYLLMDTDANGELETQRNPLEPDISTNSRRLFSWD